jgi:hypothetical protein
LRSTAARGAGRGAAGITSIVTGVEVDLFVVAVRSLGPPILPVPDIPADSTRQASIVRRQFFPDRAVRKA